MGGNREFFLASSVWETPDDWLSPDHSHLVFLEFLKAV
jgi:hypothetical protein